MNTPAPAMQDQAAGFAAPTHAGDGALHRGWSWIKGSLAGLTWKRFAIFCLVVEVVALAEPTTVAAIMNPKIKGLAATAVAMAKPTIMMLLVFLPVLLAVTFAENRGPQRGWQRVACLASAALLGQAIGTALWAGSVPLLYPKGYLVNFLGPLSDPVERLRHFAGNGILYLGLSIPAVVAYCLIKRDAELSAAMHAEQVADESTRRERAEARLQVMQAQIEPHFLFNTLASVRRLYQTDPSRGEAMLQHLAQYLTASLPVIRDTRSTLAREFALAVAYLRVQQIRMESRLAFDVELPPSLADVVIPSMMVATLVENAVIHGLGPLSEGGHIALRAMVDGPRLVLEVADTGQGLQNTWGPGVGLSNIRARLHSAFGGGARLRLTQRGERGVLARIELPWPLGADGATA